MNNLKWKRENAQNQNKQQQLVHDKKENYDVNRKKKIYR